MGSACRATLVRQGNWNIVNNSTIWNPSIPNESIPASLYLTGKPSWWGNLTWPAIGPNPTNPNTLLDGEIPAQARYYALNNITFGPYNGLLVAGNAVETMQGGNTIITANVSGGTPPYYYSWYFTNSTNSYYTSSCINSNNELPYINKSLSVSPAIKSYYCYQVMDSSSPAPYVVYSNFAYAPYNSVVNGTTSTTSTTGSSSSTSTSTTAATTAATSTSTTFASTTVSSGGGGSGAGGVGAGGGGGGSSKPVVIPISNGYIITGIAQLNSVSVNLCGTSINVVDNFITPSYSGVTVNNRQYTLLQGSPVRIVQLPNKTCEMALLNTSYLPILQTVTVEIYSNITVPNTYSGILKISGNGPMKENINLINASVDIYLKKGLATPQYTLIDLFASNANSVGLPTNGIPKNYTLIKAVNLSIYGVGQVRANVTLEYNSSMSPIPLRLLNGSSSWETISNYSDNSVASAIEFTNLNGTGLLGIFVPKSPNITATLSTTVSSITTSLQHTTITTTIPEKIAREPYGQYLVYAAIAIICAFAIYARFGLMFPPRNKRPPPIIPKASPQQQMPEQRIPGQQAQNTPSQGGQPNPPQGPMQPSMPDNRV